MPPVCVVSLLLYLNTQVDKRPSSPRAAPSRKVYSLFYSVYYGGGAACFLFSVYFSPRHSNREFWTATHTT